jgi:hypothetical protein
MSLNPALSLDLYVGQPQSQSVKKVYPQIMQIRQIKSSCFCENLRNLWTLNKRCGYCIVHDLFRGNKLRLSYA